MNPNIITCLVTLAAGILFIVFRQDTQIIDTLTMIAAVIFIVPGIANFISGLRAARRRERGWTTTFGVMLVSVGAIALGVLMLCFPAFFSNYIAIALGALLVLCGAYQIVYVLRGVGDRKAERWLVVVPMLVVAAGIVVMALQSDGIKPALWIGTGCVLILYSINGFVGMKMLTGRKTADGDQPVIVK